MTPDRTKFKTIAGRWKEHAAASQLDLHLSKKDQTMALMMFFAGFGAALDATVEAAEFPEDEAIAILELLQEEFKSFTILACQVSNVGKTPS